MPNPVDPALALVVFLFLVLLLLVCFRPRRGLFARIRRSRRSSIRIQTEDTLKQLLRAEHAGVDPSVDSLAGAIGISRAAVSNTLQRLAEQGLIALDMDKPGLTPPGREYALRILRTHRLWERYLADRTGVRPEYWHDDAEEAEHDLSVTEADALASRLGHPLYDPHGDPIPGGDGSLPPAKGSSLGRAAPGERLQVTHVEDEPLEVYRDLTNLGLAPRTRLELLRRDDNSVRIAFDGVEHEIPLVAASSVTVRPLEEGETVGGSFRTLADAEVGESVRVVGISPVCQGPQRRRLLDLGVVPGTEIVPELVSSGGDPVAYRIRGALIALRRNQAEWIRVEPTAAPSLVEV